MGLTQYPPVSTAVTASTQTVLKTSDQTRAGTTASADDDLLITGLTAGKYAISATIVGSSQANTNTSISILTFSGTITSSRIWVKYYASGATNYSSLAQLDFSNAASSNFATCNAGFAYISEWTAEMVVSTSGTLTYTWAQQTSGSFDRVFAGSTLRATKVA